MSVRKPIMRLARKISIESKTYTGIKETDPEYRILDPVVTDEMAEVAMGLKLREYLNAEEVAKNCGRPLEEVKKLLWDLAMVGVCKVAARNGEDYYMLPIWVPGIMEMMVGNRENVEKYPDIARCFEEYTRERTAILAPNLPVGRGLMRVLPVEKAISGETRRASSDEVSTYIKEAKLISVSDCSCRRSRRLMGEGCGHLEKDMCMQLNEGAEYYIRTGRARQITKEEAFEILERAEQNGLVHEIPNIDGDGKTSAICNCCGCSCFSLRIAEYFRTPDFLRSNYVSSVDKEKCVACGQCVENCNVNALRLGQKLCTITPLPSEKPEASPLNTHWKSGHWNTEYRYNRQYVVDSGTAPCKTECPAHIGIQGYIKLAAQGKYTDALELIKKENPFPAVCGRICPRTCEQACTRGDIDDPIAIDDIKKFIADQDLNKDVRFIPEIRHDYGKKIAVVGAGPAGLSCAYFLACEGYKVTVFEKQEALGGMLTLGIPSFRLEKDVVNAEIDVLKELGVEFKTGVEVGRDVSLDYLRKQGYEAFYFAIGAQAGRKLNIPGEDAHGVITGVDFLSEANLKTLKGEATGGLSGNVIVVGGGNVAIDVARTAVRSGALKVSMYCLESREEMPALDEEIEEARAEDISINNSWGPKRIIVENGRITGVEFKKCVSVFDDEHRFNPKYDENDTITVEADFVITSIGQAAQWGNLIEGTKLELNRNGTIVADPFTYATGVPDVFAGGDIVTGPKFAIDAIAAGKQGAISIHRAVHPGQSLTIGREKREYRALNKDNVELSGYDSTPRQSAPRASVAKSKETFRDLRGTFTEEQVKKETERCLSCGAVTVDENMCLGCGVCTTKCKFEAITLVKRYDVTGVPYEKLLGKAVPYITKRMGRIAVNGIKTAVTGGSKKD